MRNDTDRRVAFGVWHASDSTWDLITIDPGLVRIFEMKNAPVFVTVKGDLIVMPTKQKIKHSSDIFECFQLDSEPFNHKPTAGEMNEITPNVFQRVPRGIPLKFLGTNPKMEFAITGRDGSPVVIFVPPYKPTLEPSRLDPETIIAVPSDDAGDFDWRHAPLETDE